VTSKVMNSEGNGLEWPKDRDGGKGLFLGSTRAPSLGRVVPRRMPWHMGIETKRGFLTKSTRRPGW
jgi:hypothetical protein